MDKLGEVEQSIRKAETDLEEAQAELKAAKATNDAVEISYWKGL